MPTLSPPLLNLKQRIITDRLRERMREASGNSEHIFTCNKSAEVIPELQKNAKFQV